MPQHGNEMPQLCNEMPQLCNEMPQHCNEMPQLSLSSSSAFPLHFSGLSGPYITTVIDRGNSRVRKTLESWHTAITSQADNNAKHLPRQYSILL